MTKDVSIQMPPQEQRLEKYFIVEKRKYWTNWSFLIDVLKVH